MLKVASSSPDPDKDTLTLQRQPDTHKSDAHVSQLLAISQHVAAYLWSKDEPGTAVDSDPTLLSESRKTFELVQLRLRGLIDEERRWTLDRTEGEKESSSLVQSTLDLYNEKTNNAKTHNRPSVFLRPKIMQLELGWVVWVGGDMPRKSDLHGIGDSPELAMKAFDSVYYTVQKIAETPQTVVVQPSPAPVKKRRAVRGPRTSNPSA